MGQRTILLPVDVITKLDDRAVHIDRGREHVAKAPEYDPKLVDRSYVDEIYRHYGFAPFWMLGYTYPAFGYYR
jgi:hypothetical protein